MPFRLLLAGALGVLFPAVGLANVAPVVDSHVWVPPTVAPGEVATITVEAHDPDCVTPPCTTGCGAAIRPDISGWEATEGSILSQTEPPSKISPYSTSMEWQAPVAEGTYTVSLYLG